MITCVEEDAAIPTSTFAPPTATATAATATYSSHPPTHECESDDGLPPTDGGVASPYYYVCPMVVGPYLPGYGHGVPILPRS